MSNLQTLRTACGTGRGVDTTTEGTANKREDARRIWTSFGIPRALLDAPLFLSATAIMKDRTHTGALGSEAVSIDGSIRRVAKVAEKRLSIGKYVRLLGLFDETEDRPAREADNGTVREVANENATDATIDGVFMT